MERTEQFHLTGWQFHYDTACPPGTDSFLLSAFPYLKHGAAVCDLGSGSGLLAMLLLRRDPTLQLTCVELSRDACRLAEQNRLENGLADRMAVCPGDLRKKEQLPAGGSFDLVICNPPYFPSGSGASAPDPARRRAREESSCTFTDICRAAAHLLRWGGAFCLIHRPERLTDLCVQMRAAGLEPKRLRMVHPQAASAPNLLLMEGRRGGKPELRIERPLILQRPDGRPTSELDDIYCRKTEESI